jgi:16S rRNA (cytosine967-C5)-methyltransferase
MLNFRSYHTLQILDLYDKSKLPLDSLIRDYLKNNKAIGSKDRNQICKNIYFLIRNLSLIDSFLSAPISWQKRLEFLPQLSSKQIQELPQHIRYSCPKWLYDLLALTMNQNQLECFLETSLTEAPLTIRVNEAKCDKDTLLAQLKTDFEVIPCSSSKLGLKFFKREPVTAHPLFKQGFFEIQDEASQLACEKIAASPGDHILDFCAGAGGKALAIAPSLRGKGTIYIHDIRPHAIKEARKRFERAGIQNVQFFDPSKPLPTNLHHKMDWIVVDVPCSGTGTFRRNPDLKWKLKKEDIEHLINEQKSIFSKALTFLKPGGFIMYSTCSVLKQENQEQVDYFINKYSLKKVGHDLTLYPKIDGHDGFFASILQLDDKVIK